MRYCRIAQQEIYAPDPEGTLDEFGNVIQVPTGEFKDVCTSVRNRLPSADRRIDTNGWVLNLPGASPDIWEACGWYRITATPRPSDTSTTTWYRTYEVVDGTPTVVWVERDKTQAELDAAYPSEEESLKVAARLAIIPKLAAEEIAEADVEALTGLFPSWQPGLEVSAGEVYRWDGTLVEVIQSHTTQSDWTPDVVPALFKVHRTAAVEPWVQPTGGHDAYQTGDLVLFNGNTYQSTINANVWSPADYPAGWNLV